MNHPYAKALAKKRINVAGYGQSGVAGGFLGGSLESVSQRGYQDELARQVAELEAREDAQMVTPPLVIAAPKATVETIERLPRVIELEGEGE